MTSSNIAALTFDVFAILTIFYFSGGVPRLINTLCDYALVHAYAEEKKLVDVDIALEVISGMRIGGIQRFVRSTKDREEARAIIAQLTGVNLAEMTNAIDNSD